MNQPPGTILPSEKYGFAAQIETEQPEGLSVGDIFKSLLKNKWLILASTLVCLLGAAVYCYVTKPVYEATASIRIDPTRAGSLGLSDLLSLTGADAAGDQTATEMAVLKSDQVTLAALNSLTPEQFQAYAGFPKSQMNFNPTEQRLSGPEEGLLNNFRGSLGVKQEEGTQLVNISFRDGNPDTAALLVNHVIAAYLRQNFDSRYNSVVQARSWLSSQMDELKDRAAVAQRKLADFQERNNILGADESNNTTFDRLKLLNESLTQAESNRIVKEAQLRAADNGDPAVLASLLPDPALQALQAQEGTLYGQYVELSSKFGAAYPPLIDVKQQLTKVKAQIAEQVGTISGHLKEDYDAASRTESMLRSEYEAETARAYALNRTQADYAVLVAEGTSSRELFNTLQYKLQQASVDAGLNSVNTMIVDRARVPLVPVEPKRSLILGFGLLLGLSTGVGAALLRESATDEVQDIYQLEHRTGLIGLATIPHLPALPKLRAAEEKSGGSLPDPSLVSVRDPLSRCAECYRNLRNAVLLAEIEHPARTILITSSIPGEGKSLTSANYAVVLAQKGSRVLLIDADLRRPGLHRQLGGESESGVANRLMDENQGLIIQTPIPELPNLHFLPAGTKASLPAEILGSVKLHNLLEEWSTEYDHIIIDSAPILTVSDSLPLASWADAVVLVARAGVTPYKALLRTKSMLRRAHAHIAGIVLNDAPDAGTEYGYYRKDNNDYYK
jgi:capsular exopolysaccharide synthesis family protein